MAYSKDVEIYEALLYGKGSTKGTPSKTITLEVSDFLKRENLNYSQAMEYVKEYKHIDRDNSKNDLTEQSI